MAETSTDAQSQENAAESVANSSFARTKALLEESAVEVIDCRPDQTILETNAALYKVVERTDSDARGARIAVSDAGLEAFEKGKNFAVHADGVARAVRDELEKIGLASYYGLKGLRIVIASSEMQVEKSIAIVEEAPLHRLDGSDATAVADKMDSVVIRLGKIVVFAAKLGVLAILVDRLKNDFNVPDLLFALALALDVLVNIAAMFFDLRRRQEWAAPAELLSNALPLTLAVLYWQWWSHDHSLLYAAGAVFFIALSCASVYAGVMKFRKV